MTHTHEIRTRTSEKTSDVVEGRGFPLWFSSSSATGRRRKPGKPGETTETSDDVTTTTPTGGYRTFVNEPDDDLEEEREKQPAIRRRFDVDVQSKRKNGANGLMDLSLMLANAYQLKHLLLAGATYRFYHLMLVLISTSIALQLLIAIMLWIQSRYVIKEDITDDDHADDTRRSEVASNWSVIMIFLLTVVNVFVTAFGLSNGQ